MQKQWIWALAILAAIIIIGGIWYANSGSPTTPAAYGTPAPATAQSDTGGGTAATTTVSTTTTQAAAPAPQSFTVNGNDSSADLTSITVPKGTPVTITFAADAQGTYHGGLDFRSSVVNSGTIAPGTSKTVTFTVDQSFAFTPYWPSTNIAKPYKIMISVR